MPVLATGAMKNTGYGGGQTPCWGSTGWISLYQADLANASAESLIYQEQELSLKLSHWDFPGGPVIKNLPANAGDMVGSIPDWGTEILRATGQLSHTTTCSWGTIEPLLCYCRARKATAMRSPHTAMRV